MTHGPGNLIVHQSYSLFGTRWLVVRKMGRFVRTEPGMCGKVDVQTLTDTNPGLLVSSGLLFHFGRRIIQT